MELPPPFDPTVLAHPDPEATLSGPPAPWDFMPAPSRRDGPPWWMTEMIAAEPALSGRVLRRLGVVRRSSGVPGELWLLKSTFACSGSRSLTWR